MRGVVTDATALADSRKLRRVRFKRANIAAVAAGRVGNGGEVARPKIAALVSGQAETIALINRRTAGQQRVCERGTAVVLQRPKQRINRRGECADKVTVDTIGETGAIIGFANQIISPRNEITGEIRAKVFANNCATT